MASKDPRHQLRRKASSRRESDFDGHVFERRRSHHESQRRTSNPRIGDTEEEMGGPTSKLNESIENVDFLRHKRRQACLSFIIVMVFMVGFILVMYVHEDIEKIYEVEHALKVEMTKPYGEHSLTFNEVNDVKEIWKWLDGALMPVVVNHKDAIGHFLPKEEWGYLAEYNRVIGGMRVFQHRGVSTHCHYDKLDHFYGDCHPFDTTDYHSFGYPDCSDHDAVTAYHDSHKSSDDIDDDGGWLACYNATDYEKYVDLHNNEGFQYDYKDKAFEMWIDLFDDEEVIEKRLNYLKDRHWIDRQTKDITFELITFNGQEEPLIGKSLMTFHFSRVGYVTPELTVETVHLSPYFSHVELKIFLEVIFVFLIFYIAYTEIKEVYGRKLRRKALSVWAGKEGKPIKVTWLSSLIEHFWTGDEPLSNVIDMATVGLGTSICIEWFLLIMHMAEAEDALQTLHRPDGVVAYDDTDHDVWSDYHHEIVHFEHLVEKVIQDMGALRRLSFFMLVLMVFLMFKTWEGIPALQGVSATISNAAKSLFSFSLILGCLLTLFAGAGMLAFGQQMEEFHSFTESFVTTLIVMSTGTEEIYADQHSIDPFLAALWHWLLVCIMYVVCLNLVLCILVDAYGETQAMKAMNDNGDDPTLYEQSADTALYCAESVRRFVYRIPEMCRKKQSLSRKKAVEPEAVAASVVKMMAGNKSNGLISGKVSSGTKTGSAITEEDPSKKPKLSPGKISAIFSEKPPAKCDVPACDSDDEDIILALKLPV